jgi:hypothetical protein
MKNKTPKRTSLDVSPYNPTLYIDLTAKMAVKTALTLPPRPLQPPPIANFQQPPVYPTPQGYSPASPNQQSAIISNGRGRPAGSTTNPGTTQNQQMSQVGVMGQPSVVDQLQGQSTADQGKGFGNTPMSAQSKGHSSSSAKSASSRELRIKSALLGLIGGGAAGAISAPKGHKWEGLSRGAGRGVATQGGAELGLASDGLTGAGLGAGLGGLAGYLSGVPHDKLIEMLQAGGAIGGGIGGLGGALLGGRRGWNMAGDYMGPASYDPNNKKPDKGLAKDQEEHKHHEKKSSLPAVLSALASAGLGGASLVNAKSYSDRESTNIRHERLKHAPGQGMMTSTGAHLGGLLGGLAGAGLGYAGGKGLGALTDPSLGTIASTSGALLGGGLGLGIGAHEGGRLGYHLSKPKETDMAKADEMKNEKHSSSRELTPIQHAATLGRLAAGK